MEYWKRYCSSWPVRTLKSCLEALENPVLEVPARHGSRGSNSSFRTPSSRPTRRFHPLASSFCYPKPLPPKHTVTSPPSSSYVFPRPLSLSLHASMTILWTSTTKFRLLSLSLTHAPPSIPPTPFFFSCSLRHGTRFGHLRSRLLP